MKILLIDDHPLFLDGLMQVLSQLAESVTVVRFTDAEAALQRLFDEQDFTLVMVDINLPGMNGVEFLQALGEYKLCVPAVIMSAEDKLEVIAEALEAGALGFIPKSVSAGELIEAIRVVVSGQVFVPKPLHAPLRHLRHQKSITKGCSALSGITSRQLRVLTLLAKGHSNKVIALSMNLSEHTVKSHVKNIFAALNVANRTACVLKAEQLGLINPTGLVDDEVSKRG